MHHDDLQYYTPLYKSTMYESEVAQGKRTECDTFEDHFASPECPARGGGFSTSTVTAAGSISGADFPPVSKACQRPLVDGCHMWQLYSLDRTTVLSWLTLTRRSEPIHPSSQARSPVPSLVVQTQNLKLALPLCSGPDQSDTPRIVYLVRLISIWYRVANGSCFP